MWSNEKIWLHLLNALQIINHDVRVAEHAVSTLNNHTQEVCGLKWSTDGRYLASGGNDNLINIWENGSTNPLHSFTRHQAAVKVSFHLRLNCLLNNCIIIRFVQSIRVLELSNIFL